MLPGSFWIFPIANIQTKRLQTILLSSNLVLGRLWLFLFWLVSRHRLPYLMYPSSEYSDILLFEVKLFLVSDFQMCCNNYTASHCSNRSHGDSEKPKPWCWRCQDREVFFWTTTTPSDRNYYGKTLWNSNLVNKIT